MIIPYIFTAVLIILSLLIQGHSSFDVISIAGVKPDLLFILVVYLAYSFGSFYGEVTGFISGLLHDAISNSPLGLLAFPKMAVGFVAGMFGRSIIKSNIISITLILFIASLVKGIMTLILAYIFHHTSIAVVLHIILPEAFYNALIAPALFILFDKVYEKELEREGF
ncbi:MAG TPA: rod shape-determining protein MreD [Spirochaetota bacterium]|nr:rod shape-determining protein MreD [Spirochaetota bacterium]HRZ26151.1 rod shape-determining protein MreD [Spirochaetota bacterium]HSA13593.1 rod shape-determining protein MreD [Spirochaetota bacterium]